MNFVAGRVVDACLELPFVKFDLPDDLKAAVGDREYVTVGIRPERFEDATVLDAAHAAAGVTFTAHVDVVEWLGNEQYAYIPIEAMDSDVEARLGELERELDSERMRNQLVVALDPTSAIRPDAEAQIWLNPGHLHVFDVESGENLTAAVTAGAA